MRNFYSLGVGLLTTRECWQTRAGPGVEQHCLTSSILTVSLSFTAKSREFSQQSQKVKIPYHALPGKD